MCCLFILLGNSRLVLWNIFCSFFVLAHVVLPILYLFTNTKYQQTNRTSYMGRRNLFFLQSITWLCWQEKCKPVCTAMFCLFFKNMLSCLYSLNMTLSTHICLAKYIYFFKQGNLRLYSLLHYTLTVSFPTCCKTQMRWDQAL